MNLGRICVQPTAIHHATNWLISYETWTFSDTFNKGRSWPRSIHNICFNIIFSFHSSEWALSNRFSDWSFVYISCLRNPCYLIQPRACHGHGGTTHAPCSAGHQLHYVTDHTAPLTFSLLDLAAVRALCFETHVLPSESEGCFPTPRYWSVFVKLIVFEKFRVTDPKVSSHC